jgi:hypothetical protein
MLPDVPTISLPSINIGLIFKVFVYVILTGFVIFSALLWREVVLASRVLQTKATTLVRVMAGLFFFLIVALGAVIVFLLLA